MIGARQRRHHGVEIVHVLAQREAKEKEKESKTSNQVARLWMEDNGIGIPAEQHERVFRVFVRLHGSRYTGTGIGLSIVRKGVERIGGRVGLESAVGKGTRFWMELPKSG